MRFKQIQTSKNLNGQKPSLYDEDGERLGDLEEHKESEYFYGVDLATAKDQSMVLVATTPGMGRDTERVEQLWQRYFMRTFFVRGMFTTSMVEMER